MPGTKAEAQQRSQKGGQERGMSPFGTPIAWRDTQLLARQADEEREVGGSAP